MMKIPKIKKAKKTGDTLDAHGVPIKVGDIISVDLGFGINRSFCVVTRLTPKTVDYITFVSRFTKCSKKSNMRIYNSYARKVVNLSKTIFTERN